MKTKDMDYKQGAETLRHMFGENPEKVRLYTVNERVSASNMSAVIKVFAIDTTDKIYPIRCIARGRVHGCGLDRGFEACYNLFMYAYPQLGYQEILKQDWI
jgi:hypothetical protein